MLRVGLYLTNGTAEVVEALAGTPDIEAVVFPDLQAMEADFAELDAVILQNASYTPAIAAAAAASNRLRWIQAAATGVDSFRRQGVPAHVLLANAGDVWSDCVAEHGMALLLGLTRAIPMAERLRAERRWDRNRVVPVLRSLAGRRIVIIGLGNIGRALARRARAFDMEVTAVVRNVAGDMGAAHSIEPIESLHRILPEADVVALCLPLTAATRGLIGADEFALMKPSSLLVNVSRGEIVDQDALVAALAGGRIAGAALDVADPEPLPADHPLWAFENLILSPHVGGFDDGPTFRRLGKLCVENAHRLRDGRELRNRLPS